MQKKILLFSRLRSLTDHLESNLPHLRAELVRTGTSRRNEDLNGWGTDLEWGEGRSARASTLLLAGGGGFKIPSPSGFS